MDQEANPEGSLCPITGEMFTDPVVASDGHTYERSAITEWLESHDTSPFTRNRISTTELQPNFALKKLLEEWRTRQEAANNNLSAEIPFEELQLGMGPLGEGSFKLVQEGCWRGQRVAVATVKDGGSLQVTRIRGQSRVVILENCRWSNMVEIGGNRCK
jgi:hypothetical protein